MCLLLAAAVGGWDLSLRDETIVRQLVAGIEADFATGVHAIEHGQQPPENFPVCRLTYDESGTLTHWTNQPFLPALTGIKELALLPSEHLAQIYNRTYYQIRQSRDARTVVWLIPLHISQFIRNRFLEPYTFLGRYDPLLTAADRDALVFTAGTDPSSSLQVRDPRGKVIFGLSGFPTDAYRKSFRITAWTIAFVGLIFIGIWIYGSLNIRRKTGRALLVTGGYLLLLRGLMLYFSLPQRYFTTELFAPDILAVNALLPSLGDLTLNVLFALALCLLLYRWGLPQAARIAAFWATKFPSAQVVFSAGIAAAMLGLGAGLWWLFEVIIRNSQAETNYTNLFDASSYSFLLLFDAACLLLSVLLLMALLLRMVPQLRARNMGVAQLGISGASGLLLGAAFVLTLLMNRGETLRKQAEMEGVAHQLVGERSAETAAAFDMSLASMQADLPYIQEQFLAAQDAQMFLQWLVESYLKPNLPEFDILPFMYDEAGNRLDRTPDPPTVQEEDSTSLSLATMGEYITEQLFRTPNYADKYGDSYSARFSLDLALDRRLDFLIEISSTRLKQQSLYPALMLSEGVYRKEALVSSYEYGLYEDSVLFTQQGLTAFPARLGKLPTGTFVKKDGFWEYRYASEHGKVAWVRSPALTLMQRATTFSFIFYFLVVAALIFIVLPYVSWQLLSGRFHLRDLSLGSRIRYALIGLTLSPLIIILFFVSPLIRERYYRQVYDELNAETERVTAILLSDYLAIFKNGEDRYLAVQSFRDRVARLDQVLESDINVYDANGRLFASTQMNIFDAGVSTALMNPVVYEPLMQGSGLAMTVQERIGSLGFLSGYRTLNSAEGRIVGFVNVPYLARQDALNEQVSGFLAYLANAYLVVFLLIGMVTIFISNAIVQPLALIRQRLAETTLGRENQPIAYRSNDEIGAIVHAYNRMVEMLADSEAKLSRSQREAAWQQMAQQVAHEIKNPLTPMRLSVQHLVRTEAEDSDKFARMFPRTMRTLLTQIDSLVHIANSFSEFAKLPEAVRTPVSLTEIVESVVDLYRDTGDGVEWLVQTPKSPVTILADREQVARAVNNIVKNGLQAMEGLDRRQMMVHLAEEADHNQAVICIRDTGAGMPEEVQRRAFEPRFSTKSSGMGLGLAIVKRIVESNGGEIWFESVEGKGTAFFIKFRI